MTIGNEAMQATLRSGGRVRQLGRIPLAAASRRALADLIGHASPRSLETVVNLPPDKVLRRSVTLPLEAAENLREVLAFQMDRYTPFKASEVAYDYRVTATDTSARKVTVDLAILLRTTLEQAASIAASCGVPAHRIGIADDESERGTPFNFRPHEDPVIPSAARRRLVVALTTATALLAAAAWYLPLYFDHRALAMYEARLEETQAAALQAEDLKKRLAAAVDLSQALVDRRAATPTLTSLIADITDRLPDGTWLTQLQVHDGTLTLTGFSSSAAPLIARLEASPLLAQVRFGSPVTPDQSVGAERFNIVAQVAPDRSS
jgi:general secretion pathway protein L